MAVRKKNINLFVDAALLLGFPAAFAVDLTGLPLHQWLGVLIAALAVYHLWLHWGWCRNVTERLAGPLPGKTRLCWLLDAGLLLGLSVIVVTGLAISTWRETTPAAYDLWRDWHTASSYITLGMLALKLALKFVFSRSLPGSRKPRAISPREGVASLSGHDPAGMAGRQPASSATFIGRRQALSLLGMAGLAVPLALQVFRLAEPPLQPAVSPDRMPLVEPPPSTRPRKSAGSAVTGSTAPPNREMQPADPDVRWGKVEPATWTAPDVTASGPASLPVATASAAPAACTIRCPKHCAYPGRCRRYVDGNANGLCDLGECL